MKKIPVILSILMLTLTAVAQQKKPVQKPAAATPKPVASHPVSAFKNASDSLSYAVGMSLANFYKQQGIKSINTGLVNEAINDVLKNNKPRFTEEQMNMCITNYLQKQKSDKASGNKKTGEAFLAANKSKPGVVTTASGLQYQVIKQGTGPKPAASDTVKCLYKGTLIDGTEFDSSEKHGGQPAEFPVDRVIAGWTEALQLMPVGSKWRLFIPSQLAYGDNQAGPDIAPGSTLIFEVELVSISGK